MPEFMHSQYCLFTVTVTCHISQVVIGGTNVDISATVKTKEILVGEGGIDCL